jgi:uncharacterized protein (TIGR02266 family)
MASEGDRRHQRVAFHARVRVSRPEERQALSATALNLSERGVFVAAREPVRVGTRIVCSIPLLGASRALRGRVAWVRDVEGSAAVRPPGMGVEFVDLSQDDERILRQAVGGVEEHPLRVWFGGLQEAVGAKAVLTPDGIRLRAPLPFLRVTSTVKFASADRPEEIHVGTLQDVRLVTAPGEASMIEVDVGLRAASRERLAERQGKTAETVPDPTAQISAAPRRRGMLWVSGWIGLGLVIGGVILATMEVRRRRHRAPPSRPPVQMQSSVAPESPADPSPVAVAELPTRTEPAEVSPPAPPVAQPTPEPSFGPASPAPAVGAPRRTLEVTPGRLFVPVSGSLADMQRIRIGRPPGLVVTLPHATTSLSRREYRLEAHGFRLLKVRAQRAGGVQLRIFFTHDPPATAELETTDGGVVVELPQSTTISRRSSPPATR